MPFVIADIDSSGNIKSYRLPANPPQADPRNRYGRDNIALQFIEDDKAYIDGSHFPSEAAFQAFEKDYLKYRFKDNVLERVR